MVWINLVFSRPILFGFRLVPLESPRREVGNPAEGCPLCGGSGVEPEVPRASGCLDILHHRLCPAAGLDAEEIPRYRMAVGAGARAGRRGRGLEGAPCPHSSLPQGFPSYRCLHYCPTTLLPCVNPMSPGRSAQFCPCKRHRCRFIHENCFSQDNSCNKVELRSIHGAHFPKTLAQFLN